MVSINFAVARHNMVEQQIRPWEVLDDRVLELIARAPREDYVPEAMRALAYVDMQIPLGQGQVMMEPKIEARLLQALELQPTDRILEVGTGSGYLTSLLANLGSHVYSVEIIPEFMQQAAQKLAAHGIRNVTLDVGDAAQGWGRHAPYDVIVITGSVPLLPASFRDSLKDGGRLAAIVGESPVMEVKLIRRLARDSFSETDLFETDLPPLINAKAPSRFVF